MIIVTYPSSTELGKEYSITPVPTAETDAILIKPVGVDSASAADIGGNTQGTLFINFTIGSLTKIIIRTYGSYKNNPEAGDWHQEVIEKNDTTTLGLTTLGVQYIEISGTAKIAWHFPVGAFRSYKITIEGDGTATDSALTLNCSLKVN